MPRSLTQHRKGSVATKVGVGRIEVPSTVSSSPKGTETTAWPQLVRLIERQMLKPLVSVMGGSSASAIEFRGCSASVLCLSGRKDRP